MSKSTKKIQVADIFTSSTLHILAMALMVCDHAWGTIAGDQRWLTCVGRVAYPIFAFMLAEGIHRTSNVKRYLGRLFLFAVISEIPFNLMMGGSFKGLGHQNVLWTFILAVLLIQLFEKAKSFLGKLFKVPPEITKVKNLLEFLRQICLEALSTYRMISHVIFILFLLFIGYIIGFAGFLIGSLSMVDYFGPGVLTIFVFYFLHKRKLIHYIVQLLLIGYINMDMIAGRVYPIQLFGIKMELPEQGLALLALIPIWLYGGKKGYSKRWFSYFCYAFYPAHMLLLYLLQRIMY